MDEDEGFQVGSFRQFLCAATGILHEDLLYSWLYALSEYLSVD